MNKKLIVGAQTADGKTGKSVILKFKCMLTDQMQYFLPEETRSYRDDHGYSVCKYLQNAKFAAIDNKVLYSAGNTMLDHKMIDCIWAMIDMLTPHSEEETPLYIALKNSFALDEPESLCFIQNNKSVIRAMALETASEIGLLSLEQNKLYTLAGAVAGEEYKIDSTLLIVIRDKNMLASIGNLGLKIPHKIAVLEGGMLEKPRISYYGNR